MKNIFNFTEEHKDDCFRYLVHKKIWTPYEQDLKDEYQCLTECDTAMYGYIVECVELPNGDVLLGLSESRDGYISYYKLSELDLALSDKDNE